MQVIGTLMIEHRLIERMLALMRREREDARHGRPMAPAFVRTAVDFVRNYADRTHHGKEEDILFRELAAKNLAPALRATMEELVGEHVWARRCTEELDAAARRLATGAPGAAEKAARAMEALIEFYPRHIGKEDKTFFPAAMPYFTEQEQQGLLREFADFDRTLIHELHKELVSSLEKSR